MTSTGRPALTIHVLIAAVAHACAGTGAPAERTEPSRSGVDGAMIDAAVNPCDDFYRHACGGWMARAVIPPGSQLAERVTDLVRERIGRILDDVLAGTDRPGDPEVDRLRTFYASCMVEGESADRAAERAIARRLAPIDAIRTRADAERVLRDLHAEGIAAFFTYSGEPDRAVPDRYRGQIGQGAFGLRRGDLIDASREGAARRAIYRDHVARTFVQAGVERGRARREADRVVDLEIALARASLSRGDSFDPVKSEHPMTMDGLAALAPHIDWRAYMAMVVGAERAGAGAVARAPVNVTWPDHLRTVDRALATRPPRELAAFLRWRLLDEIGPAALPSRMAGERRDQCRLATVKALGVELSRQFARRAVPDPARRQAEALARAIRDTSAATVDTAGWLSPGARAASADKLRRTELDVGYPTEWPATGTFPLRADDYLENVFAARAHEARRAWERAFTDRRRARASWQMMVYPNDAPGMAAARLTIPNGFPDGFTNSIILTAAMLQPPLFDPSAPPEVQYATLGSLIAHELIHVAETHELDATGIWRELWSAADIRAHAGRRACLVDQAGRFVAFDSTRLDGSATLDENVADLGGAVHAYRAMRHALGPVAAGARGRDGLTGSQRFFYAYAQRWCAVMRPDHERESVRTDTHAPPRFRVNGPLSNMPEFAAAFSCPARAPMVRAPPARCAVW